MSLWTDFMGAEIKYYQAGPWRTRVAEAGRGTPLVLIHGGGGHLEAYAKNVIPLAQHFHVYAIDALGHGLTDKPMDVEVTTKTQAEHVKRFMDAAGIDKAHLAGESMGGAILGWFAYLCPERTLKYVSICGAGLNPPEGKTPQEQEEQADFAKRTREALANPTAAGLRPRLEWLFHDKRMVTDELAEVRANIWGSPEYQAFARRPRSGGGIESLWSVLPEMGARTPVLFLWTEHNPGTHLSTARRAHELTPNSKLAVIKDSGHWPQYEQPDEFNRILVDFLLKD
jgi:pimeloyl-ACP methyl ester carboxylesterase